MATSPWRDKPFARLVAHFAAVIVNAGQDSGESDLNLGIGGLLAILAVPGAFVSITLFDKYSSLLRYFRNGRAFDHYIASIPDKYFFVVFSMVVTGVVVTLKWDRIFPSLQDYANLAPLPIPARNIYVANLAAIALLACIFAIDVNAVSALLFPMVVIAEGGTLIGYVAFVGAHAATVILASAFTFFACFAIIGALLSCLPHAAFRKVSLFVRLAIMIALMAMLCSIFSVPPQLAKLAANPHSYVRWLPPVWYLALYQSFQGKAFGELAQLASLALKALALVFGLAAFFGALGYRQYFRRIPESSDRRQTPSRTRLQLGSALLDRILLKDPFQRACYHFGLRALFRSETHCILIGAFAGLGLITAAQSIMSVPAAKPGAISTIPHADLLAAPLCVVYFLVAGLRLTFELPAGLTSNWIFRLTVDRAIRDGSAVARKLILSFLVPGVILPSLVAYSVLWGPQVGLLEGAVVTAMSLLLIETLLIRFRKIPFACAMPSFQNNAISVIVVYVIGFFVFTSMTSHIEHWMLLQPIRFLGAIPFAGLSWYALRAVNYEEGDPDAALVYDSRIEDAVQKLNLLGS